MHWLFKEEPSHYSYAALEADGGTRWSGVKNPQAQKYLRSVTKGDLVLYYHTGDEKAVVGVATARADAYPDPDDKAGKVFVVDVVPMRKLARPVTLGELKAEPAFRDSPLARIPRLSVMPITDEQWRAVERLAGKPPKQG